MVTVFIGIGSNIEPHRNIQEAINILTLNFSDIEFSRVFESEAIGFEGDNFLNLVARIKLNQQDGFNKTETLETLINQLKLIENQLGRKRTSRKFSARNIDIDILLFGQLQTKVPVELPREEIFENAYVLWPLSELAPELKPPNSEQNFGQYWREFDSSNQKIKPIDLPITKP